MTIVVNSLSQNTFYVIGYNPSRQLYEKINEIKYRGGNLQLTGLNSAASFSDSDMHKFKDLKVKPVLYETLDLAFYKERALAVSYSEKIVAVCRPDW